MIDKWRTIIWFICLYCRHNDCCTFSSRQIWSLGVNIVQLEKWSDENNSKDVCWCVVGLETDRQNDDRQILTLFDPLHLAFLTWCGSIAIAIVLFAHLPDSQRERRFGISSNMLFDLQLIVKKNASSLEEMQVPKNTFSKKRRNCLNKYQNDAYNFFGLAFSNISLSIMIRTEACTTKIQNRDIDNLQIIFVCFWCSSLWMLQLKLCYFCVWHASNNATFLACVLMRVWVDGRKFIGWILIRYYGNVQILYSLVGKNTISKCSANM